MTDDDFHRSDLPGVEPFDDRVVRRAVLRGMLRTALVATVWLAVLLMLTVLVSAGFSAHRGPRFHAVAYNGLRMAHPEYEISQVGGCCARGPLFGLTNLGLASSMTLRLTPVGALNYPGSSAVTVTQDVSGDLDPGIDDSLADTPLRQALNRGRPASAATAGFLAELPEPTVMSVLVEFARPLGPDAFDTFLDTAVPATVLPYRSVPVFLVDPYASRADQPIGWPNQDFDELRDWADRLDPSADPLLRRIGLPPADEIRRTCADPRVYAFVAPALPLSLVRTLAADPTVRGLRVLDVAFDTTGRTG